RRPSAPAAPRLAERAEEATEQRAALAGEHPLDHLDAVVAAGMAEDLVDASVRALLGIAGAIDAGVDPSLDHRPGAHRAGLEGDHHRHPGEPPAAERPGRT